MGENIETAYQDGRLMYEIETFTGAGDCEISYYRSGKE